MAKTVLIAAAEPGSGKSVITIGLVNSLLCKTKKVAFFKPIINTDDKDKKDVHIQAILNHFELLLNYTDTYAFTRQEAMTLISRRSDQSIELVDGIVNKNELLQAASFSARIQFGLRRKERCNP